MANKRDYIMARLAAARSHAQTAIDGIDNCVDLFMDPEEDMDGSERRVALDIVSEASGLLSRSIELAEGVLDALPPSLLREGEPDFEEDEDEGEAA